MYLRCARNLLLFSSTYQCDLHMVLSFLRRSAVAQGVGCCSAVVVALGVCSCSAALERSGVERTMNEQRMYKRTRTNADKVVHNNQLWRVRWSNERQTNKRTTNKRQTNDERTTNKQRTNDKQTTNERRTNNKRTTNKQQTKTRMRWYITISHGG